MQYESYRSVNDKSVHLIFPEGTFDSLPDKIRHRGPWQGLKRGELDKLRPEYQRAISEVGYVILDIPACLFRPEV